MERVRAGVDLCAESRRGGARRAVRVDGPITRTLVVASAREYWLRFSLGSPGTREMLAEAERIGGAQAVLAIEQAALADLRARFGDGEVRLDASAYVASGVSPG